MQARCPRCASVFNTDRSGLQFCPHCGQQVDVPSFPGAPPEGTGAGWGGPSGPGGPGSFGPGPAVREDTPWERRATLGWFTGLFETWKRTLLSPQPFWASVRPEASWTDALLYAWILFGVGLLLTWPLAGMRQFGLQAALAHAQDLPPGLRAMLRNYGSGFGVGQFLFTALFYPLGLIVYTAILHLFCMLFGVAKHGYYATFRVVAYSSATNVFSLFPCVGFLAGLYGVVLIILGLASVQESTLGRAAAAVLVPLLLVICCACGAALLLGAGVASFLGQLPNT
jgi:hypothetical protein